MAGSGKTLLGIDADTDAVLIHQLAAGQACQQNHDGRKQGEIDAPGINEALGILNADHPVEAGNRQHYHRKDGMVPGGNEKPNALDGQQVDQAHSSCNPATGHSEANKPDTAPCPEGIVRIEKGAITENRGEQERHRKVNERGMDGMSGNGHATVDGLLHRLFFCIHQSLSLVAFVPAKCKPQAMIIFALLLTACRGPQSALDPAGPSASMVATLWWGMVLYFSLVLFAVVALWVYALFRLSPEQNDENPRRIARRWIIGGGLILPLATVTVLLGLGIPIGYRMLPLPLETEPIRIRVIGQQWWWEIHYPTAEVVTANELAIPVGQPVNFELTSRDVIHSFWIPRLGGKLDLMPGRINVLRLQADETGSFRGQCAEFCGWRHAHMILPVEVLSDDEFEAWLRQRRQPLAVDPGQESAAAAFRQSCGQCHSVNGVSEGRVGPNLSTIGIRPFLGGRARGEDWKIIDWLRDNPFANQQHASAQTSLAPDHSAIAPQHHALIANWLETLGHE